MQRKQMKLVLLFCALVCLLTLAVSAAGTKAVQSVFAWNEDETGRCDCHVPQQQTSDFG